MGEKLDRQIGMRVNDDLFLRIQAQAKRDRIKVAALARRLIEWSLPNCEEVKDVIYLEKSKVVQGR